MAKAKVKYDEKAIQTLDALEHIRLRTGMYIGRLGDGSTPVDGIYVMSVEIEDWAGINRYAPGVASLLAIFFFALAGIPPLAGWFAKFVMFRSVMGGGAGAWGAVLAVIAAVNAVIALYYYARVVKTVFMDSVDLRDGTTTGISAADGDKNV